jgi:dihydroneopterin aldolase/2-amino-4-hydroxy-6-hydroxymethyldihydropteridine diphosphokinase
MDSITITGITAQGTHGVLDFEKQRPQTFVVDVRLFLDLSQAGRDDDLTRTVDYGQIARRIVSVIQGPHCDLIETLATRIADAVLRSSLVRSVVVTVHKPHAPVTVPFSDVAVTIERSQPGVRGAAYSVVHAHRREGGDDGETAGAGAVSDASVVSGALSAEKAAASQEGGRQADGDSAGPDGGRQKIHHAVLSLGGNLGDVAEAMRQAIVSLDGIAGDQIMGISPLYRTTPWGMEAGTPDFLNCVVELETLMQAHELLHTIHLIEAAHGRTRQVHWGSRPLDIDIIDFDGRVSADPDLTLPHPRAWQRAFVLVPLADLEPDFLLPGPHGGRVADLLDACPDKDSVVRAGDDWILSAGRRPSSPFVDGPYHEEDDRHDDHGGRDDSNAVGTDTEGD